MPSLTFCKLNESKFVRSCLVHPDVGPKRRKSYGVETHIKAGESERTHRKSNTEHEILRQNFNRRRTPGSVDRSSMSIWVLESRRPIHLCISKHLVRVGACQ